jgi:hypothetical protein
MSDALLTPAAIVALIGLTATAALAQTESRMSAEEGWSSIARCAEEDTARARHACVDRVLREAGLLTTEMRARQARQAFGLENEPVRPQARSTLASNETPASAGSGASDPDPASPEMPDRVEVELASVSKAADGRLLVTTTDGAVWRQTESVTIPKPPVAGDRMTIRKGALGGYRCTLVSTRLTYRCVRTR